LKTDSPKEFETRISKKDIQPPVLIEKKESGKPVAEKLGVQSPRERELSDDLVVGSKASVRSKAAVKPEKHEKTVALSQEDIQPGYKQEAEAEALSNKKIKMQVRKLSTVDIKERILLKKLENARTPEQKIIALKELENFYSRHDLKKKAVKMRTKIMELEAK